MRERERERERENARNNNKFIKKIRWEEKKLKDIVVINKHQIIIVMLIKIYLYILYL